MDACLAASLVCDAGLRVGAGNGCRVNSVVCHMSFVTSCVVGCLISTFVVELQVEPRVEMTMIDSCTSNNIR